MSESITVETTVEQCLTGALLAAPGACRCQHCGAALREGRRAGAYCYRAADADRWDVARVYCESCAPDGLDTPTLACAEVVATGRLAVTALPTRRHRLTLVEVGVRDYAGPREGSGP